MNLEKTSSFSKTPMMGGYAKEALLANFANKLMSKAKSMFSGGSHGSVGAMTMTTGQKARPAVAAAVAAKPAAAGGLSAERMAQLGERNRERRLMRDRQISG